MLSQVQYTRHAGSRRWQLAEPGPAHSWRLPIVLFLFCPKAPQQAQHGEKGTETQGHLPGLAWGWGLRCERLTPES